MDKSMCYGFRRSGTMAAALVIKVSDKSEQYEDSLSLYAEASNGQMPNLDLINRVNYLAAHRQGFRVKVDKFWSIFEFKWLNFLGELFESVGQVIRSLNPQLIMSMVLLPWQDHCITRLWVFPLVPMVLFVIIKLMQSFSL